MKSDMTNGMRYVFPKDFEDAFSEWCGRFRNCVGCRFKDVRDRSGLQGCRSSWGDARCYDLMDSAEYDRISCAYVDLARGIGMIGSMAFQGSVARYVSLPRSLRVIGANAFDGCDLLERVTVPKRVSLIGKCAFVGCAKLGVVIFQGGSALEEIGDLAFCECVSLQVLDLSFCRNLKRIGRGAFRGCTGLAKVVFPKGVEEVDHVAFASCRRLLGVYFRDGMKRLGENAFKGCFGLKDLCFPAGVEIGFRALDTGRPIAVKFAESFESVRHKAFYPWGLAVGSKIRCKEADGKWKTYDVGVFE